MKKLLVCLTVLFSAFLFTNKVSASGLEDFTQFGVNITEADIEAYAQYNNIDRNIYDAYIVVIGANYSSSGKPGMGWTPTEDYYNFRIIFFNYQDMLNNTIYVVNTVPSSTTTKNATFNLSYKSSGRKYLIYSAHKEIKYLSNFPNITAETKSLTSGGLTPIFTYLKTDTNPQPLAYYSNVDLLYQDGTVAFSSSLPTSYNVTFHLNGGKVYDNNFITDNIGSYIIGNKYEDYTSSITSQ